MTIKYRKSRTEKALNLQKQERIYLGKIENICLRFTCKQCMSG